MDAYLAAVTEFDLRGKLQKPKRWLMQLRLGSLRNPFDLTLASPDPFPFSFAFVTLASIASLAPLASFVSALTLGTTLGVRRRLLLLLLLLQARESRFPGSAVEDGPLIEGLGVLPLPTFLGDLVH